MTTSFQPSHAILALLVLALGSCGEARASQPKDLGPAACLSACSFGLLTLGTSTACDTCIAKLDNIALCACPGPCPRPKAMGMAPFWTVHNGHYYISRDTDHTCGGMGLFSDRRPVMCVDHKIMVYHFPDQPPRWAFYGCP